VEIFAGVSDVKGTIRFASYRYPYIDQDVSADQAVTDICSLGRGALLRKCYSTVNQERLAEIESHQTKTRWYNCEYGPFELLRCGYEQRIGAGAGCCQKRNSQFRCTRNVRGEDDLPFSHADRIIECR